MNVLSITPAFFPATGGLEQVVLELAKGVRRLGVHMDVAHVARGLDASTDSVEGIAVHRVPLWGSRFAGWAPSLAGLAAGYDLLHVHDPQLTSISSNVRWQCGRIPAVLSTHGGFWHTDRFRIFKKIFEATQLRGNARHYRRVLASSVADFNYFKRFVAHIAVCGNGVAVKRFEFIRADRDRCLLKWIYWGRLSRNKRLDLAIQYVHHARELGHPVELLVCGRDFDGLLAQLRAQVQRLNLNHAVTFVPHLDDADLRSELSRRGVFITASEYEGFGLSIVEAMASGLMVICRDLPPMNSFFRHGEGGWLLKFDDTPGDIASLDAMLRVAEPRVATMSAAARSASRAHDWNEVSPHFVRHYREVLAE